MMTCVVAVVGGDGKIVLGADSAASDNDIITSHINPKVFVKGEFGIGYCHSFRLGQVIEYWFVPPDLPEKTDYEDLMRYMVTAFIPALRSALEENNYPTHDDEKTDWSMIVGVRGNVFVVESDWHVGHDDLHFAAIGAGAPYALGAMWCDVFANPFQKAKDGLLCAIEFSPYVIGPLNFIEV